MTACAPSAQDRAKCRNSRDSSTSSRLQREGSGRETRNGQKAFQWRILTGQFHFHGEEKSGPRRQREDRSSPRVRAWTSPNTRYASRAVRDRFCFATKL